jgi:IS30 family transposase
LSTLDLNKTASSKLGAIHRRRARSEDRRGKMPNMTSIHQRHPEIDERVNPGHFEGDLIKGRSNASAVGTIVERTSLFVTHPQSLWQRGINENTNGLLRQYLPKGIDLSVFSQEDLDAVAWALNTRPRKSLGFKCPAELFLPDTFNADEYYRRLVALHAFETAQFNLVPRG